MGEKQRRNEVGNFLVDEVDGAVMRAFVADNALEVDVDVPDEQLAVWLSLHFAETTAHEDLLKCERCDGETPAALPTCPMCGLRGGPGAEVKEETSPASGRPDAAPVVPPEPPAPPPAPAKVVHLKGRAKAKKVKGAPAALATSGNAAIAAEPDGAPEAKVEADLDRAVADVERLRGDTAESFHAQGKKLLEINEGELWRLRTKEDGKPAYRGFDTFVERECHMTVTNAWDLIEVARNYTVEEIRALGKTRAAMILKAPPEARPELEEKAAAGATVRELREEVGKIREETGYAKPGQQAKAGKKGGKKKAQKAAANAAAASRDKITVAQVEGRRTVKLYRRPDNTRDVDLKNEKRAKNLGDQPWGRIELANEVVLYVSFGKDKGGLLVANVDIRREVVGE